MYQAFLCSWTTDSLDQISCQLSHDTQSSKSLLYDTEEKQPTLKLLSLSAFRSDSKLFKVLENPRNTRYSLIISSSIGTAAAAILFSFALVSVCTSSCSSVFRSKKSQGSPRWNACSESAAPFSQCLYSLPFFIYLLFIYLFIENETEEKGKSHPPFQ